MVKDLVEPKKVVLEYGRGNVTIHGDTLFWKGEVLHSSLSRRMLSMLREGFSIEPLVLFMENLQENPSKRSVDELYGFLEKNDLPITPDGHFLAYKKVRGNFMDVHSNTVLNAPAYLLTDEQRASMPLNQPNGVVTELVNGATVVHMPRNRVDDEAQRVCSTGLHFCSRSYLSSFGGEKTLIVKVNPRDVVSVPVDHDQAKARASRYEIVAELGVDPDQAFTAAVQSSSNEPLLNPVHDQYI